ncbi:MAG: hypothetical protein A2Z04_05770 [Chloroflexi bacterium RBG_16_57_9]|nr:MAG: hypothetical protein A2Z04_05770 [Chloroflexi bacterium RBG_16_57_9]
MPLFAVSLLVCGAFIHALWNLLLKSSQHKVAFMWWALFVGTIGYGAILVWTTPLIISQTLWPILILSGLAETGYALTLTHSYDDGDLSQVYPISRGSAPIFIVLWSGLFLNERLPWVGYAGIALIVGGIYLASLPDRREFFQPLRALDRRPAQWALAAGLFISIYSVVDKVGVGLAGPWVYNLYAFAVMTALLAPYVWQQRERSATCAEWRAHWPRIVLAGAMVTGNYVLVLWALSLTRASYVGAVRGVSVIFGAAFGWLLLKESLGLSRLVAAGLMFAGIACLSLAK